MRTQDRGGRWPAAALVALVAATLVAGCRRGGEQTERVPHLEGLVASCAQAEGLVELHRAGTVYWEPVGVGALFRDGDWIRTAKGARARVELFAGGGLDLEPETLVVLGLSRGGAKPEPTVAVESGAVRGTLPAASLEQSSGAALTVKTADGAQVRLVAQGREGQPAVVSLRARSGVTQVALVEGGAQVQDAGGGSQALVAGQLLELVDGAARARQAALALPESLAPAVDAKLALSLGEPLELRWAAVEGAAGYRVQVARDFSFRRLERDERVEQTSFRFPCDGERAWRVAAVDAFGSVGEFGFARRVSCQRR
jgi:hypothetical protein